MITLEHKTPNFGGQEIKNFGIYFSLGMTILINISDLYSVVDKRIFKDN